MLHLYQSSLVQIMTPKVQFAALLHPLDYKIQATQKARRRKNADPEHDIANQIPSLEQPRPR